MALTIIEASIASREVWLNFLSLESDLDLLKAAGERSVDPRRKNDDLSAVLDMFELLMGKECMAGKEGGDTCFLLIAISFFSFSLLSSKSF